ncbi:hypothetical protein EI94DRAFT_1705234 [Lactarius quietus]|nr:hypothetical protein EI94DRAFT_1705234 [Lactarius quietus]
MNARNRRTEGAAALTRASPPPLSPTAAPSGLSRRHPTSATYPIRQTSQTMQKKTSIVRAGASDASRTALSSTCCAQRSCAVSAALGGDAAGAEVRETRREAGPGDSLASVAETHASVCDAFGAPRICTIPAPSRVSSSVHAFEVTDIGDATCVISALGNSILKPGRAGANVVDVNMPRAFATLLLSESRQVSIALGSKIAPCVPSTCYRSAELSDSVEVAGGVAEDGLARAEAEIAGLKYRGLGITLDSRGVPTSSSAVGGRLDSSPEVIRPHLQPDSHGRLRDRDRMRSHQAKRVIIVAVPAMHSNATPAQNEAPCPLSELIVTAGTKGDTDGVVEDVTPVGREVVVATPGTMMLAGWSWFEIPKLCLTERWPTARTKYQAIAITKSACCFIKSKDERRTGTEAEIDGRTARDETVIAEEPPDMLGDAIDDSEDDIMELWGGADAERGEILGRLGDVGGEPSRAPGRAS